VFHELIELVHIDIYKKLRGEVPERKPHTRSRTGETLYHSTDEQVNLGIRNVSLKNSEQYSMVDTREELPNVTLEHPDRARMIMRDFIRKRAKTIECLMCPLPLAARIRVGDERAVEERVQLPIERMVE
jgi:dsDNA-specific endonuclease/ATPase MutS2